MTSFNKRVYQMLRRVLVFGQTHPELFVKGTLAGRRMAEIEAIAELFATHAESQTRGKRVVTISTGGRADAREDLRSQLEAIGRSSKAAKLGVFWMPRDRSDEALLNVARSLIKDAASFREPLIQANLPEDFVERLIEAAGKLDAALKGQESTRRSQMRATKDLDQIRAEAVVAARSLDLILTNALPANSTLLAVWKRLRRVTRGSVSKTAEADPDPTAPPPAPDPPTPAVTTSSATAA